MDCRLPGFLKVYFQNVLFYTILKVALHLGFLQNIGYVPRGVQDIFVVYLTPNRWYFPHIQSCTPPCQWGPLVSSLYL